MRCANPANPWSPRAASLQSSLTSPPGQSLGIHQKCVGLCGGETKIILDLQMYLDAPLPHDAIVIRGRPDLNLVLNGGVAGDDATVAALINIIPRLLAANPGVRLMTELAVPSWQNPQRAIINVGNAQTVSSATA